MADQHGAEVGKSPFLAKGAVYAGAHDYYEEHVPGGFAAVCAALDDAALRAFVSQPFLTRSSYDVLPIIPLSRVAAGVAGLAHRDLVVGNARWLAERDIGGVLRVLLRLASPAQVAQRLPRATLHYFNFGAAEGRLVDRTTLDVKQTGIPTPLALWMVWAVDGFATVALELAGARSPKILMMGSAVRDGEKDGLETSTLSWRIRWSE